MPDNNSANEGLPPPRSSSIDPRGSLSHFGAEVWRVKWMIAFAITITYLRASGSFESSPALLLFYKPALAAIGFITAHVGYQQAFPYIDQNALLQRSVGAAEPDERDRVALLFVGASILRGLIYAAFILGVTLGL
jgi:hypothetical protein